MEEVTFFDVDFESILCRADTGERLREPIEDYLHKLSEDVEFHARKTREHRTDSLGKSWREIPWKEIYNPTSRSPWDSRRAFNPAQRNSMDCTTALGQLETLSRPQPGILHGAGKSINPYRLRTVGGLASITQVTRRKDKPVEAGKCPFCRRAPVDSLQPGHITNPRGFMDYKLNPRVDLGFVFMSMRAFWTHVIFSFYEYTIGKESVVFPGP